MATLAYRDISRTSVKQSVPDPPITLIIRQPYTDSLSFKDEVIHELIIRKPYTGSLSFQDAILHGLIIRQPYTGSSFPNEVLHGLIMK